MLEMDKLSAAKRRLLHFTKYQMMTKAQEVFRELGDDEELGSADWPTIKKYFTCLNDADEDHIHPHTDALESNSFVGHMHLSDMRILFLNAVQAAYQGMLVEGRINQSSANVLMQSVDGAIDLVLHGPLSDWNGLKASVHFPSYYKFLQTGYFPQKLLTYFTVKRLEFACYIAAAFLRAHRIARQQLHKFIRDGEIGSVIINESVKQGEEAKKFLEDVRLTFPEVLDMVKTKQVGCSVLHQVSEYVQDLKKVGLLGKMELVHLHDTVQDDMRKLVGLVETPKADSANPLLGVLPTALHEQMVKLPGVALYREGSQPIGIWLVSNGVVKWDSKRLDEKTPLNPTFPHGSTLGLYEVLTGKPYICDIITDSLVLCVFIKAETILSVLGTDNAVADVLWQECSITLSKMLIPEIFDKMSMYEARRFMAECSSMRTYMAGETVELPDNTVGLLLQGFLSSLQTITAPAALFPTYGLVVETQARVLVFDLSEATGGSSDI